MTTVSAWARQEILPKVFICYASEDASLATRLADALLDYGYPVWLDRLCIQPGQDWQEEIRGGVDSSDAVVVLVSRHSTGKTGFVQQEIRLALDQAERRPVGSIYIVPLLLDKTQPPLQLRKWHRESVENSDWQANLHMVFGSMGIARGSGWADRAADGPYVNLRRLHLVRAGTAPVIVDYTIDLRQSGALRVELGASLITADGRELHDTRCDRHVVLRSGVATYRRRLPRFPEMSQTGWKLIGGVWSPNIGDVLAARTEFHLGDIEVTRD